MNKQNIKKLRGVLWTLCFAVLSLGRAAAGTCHYELSPTNRVHGYGATTGMVAVITTTGCPWTAATTNSWIAITSGLSGNGPGQVNYSIELNPNFAERTGAIRVAGQVLQLVQGAYVCEYSISPTNRVHGYGASSGTVNLTTGTNCSWTVVNTNSWISIASATNGSGPSTIGYSIEPNPFPADRRGTVWIGGEAFTLTQQAVICRYSISPDNRTHGNGGSGGVITLSTSDGCEWTVLNTNTWITITSATQGLGSASISYLVSANLYPSERVGLVWIQDQVCTLTQGGITCSFSISPTNRTHGYGAATGTVDVTTSSTCNWTIWNTNDWIIFPKGANGLGSDTVTYWVLANPVMQIRTAMLTIAGQGLTFTQRAAVCQYDLTPSGFSHGVGSETGFVTVTATPTCPWTAIKTNDWITLTSSTNGLGSGTVTYTVAANPNPGARTGILTIAGDSFTIKQAGTACASALSTLHRTHGHGATSGTIEVATAADCDWTVINTNDWITITSSMGMTGSGAVTYLVSANPNPADRIGILLIGGQVVTLTQLAMPCTYSLTPTNRVHGYAKTTGSVMVATAPTCPWSALSTNDWITVSSGTNGLGEATITYIVEANPYALWRTGWVAVADQTLTLAQRSSPCDYSLTPGSRVHGHGATNGTISLITGSSCAWTVINANDWLEIVSFTNGMGSADIFYAIQENPDLMVRSGVVLIGGEPFFVTQQAANCDYSISPATRTHGYGGTNAFVSVTAADQCSWTVSTTNDWIIITSPTNGAGTGKVDYFVLGNPNTAPRLGAILIADQMVGLTQRGMTNLSTLLFERPLPVISNHINLVLMGPPGAVLQLESSGDLRGWLPWATLTNSTGQVEFICNVSTNLARQFYRAVIAPSASTNNPTLLFQPTELNKLQ